MLLESEKKQKAETANEQLGKDRDQKYIANQRRYSNLPLLYLFICFIKNKRDTLFATVSLSNHYE